MFQENLLNDNNSESVVLRPHGYLMPSYIVQLDAMPVFNPALSNNANSLKPFDPPPSYEEVCYGTYRWELYFIL